MYRYRILGWGVIAWLLSLCSAFAAPDPLAPKNTKNWKRYTSPHFELYSAGKDKESRAILRQFELMDAFFFETLRFARRAPKPATLFLFASEEKLSLFLPDDFRDLSVGGLYLATPDRACVLLRNDLKLDELRSTVLHEFVHHLIAEAGLRFPLWLDEGLAEYYSTLAESRKGMEMGRAIPESVDCLNLIGTLEVADLLAVRTLSKNPTKTTRFYAQSWLLVHYMLTGQNDRGPAVGYRFLNWAASHPNATPEGVAQALAEHLGLTTDELDRELRNYLRSGSYFVHALPPPALEPSSTYQVTPVSPEQIQVRLAELALVLRKDERMLPLLVDQSQRPNPDSRVLATLGTYHFQAGEFAPAVDYYTKAIAADEQDTTLVPLVADIELDPLLEHYDPDLTLSATQADHLRTLLLRTIARHPELPRAYEALAWVEAFSEQPHLENVKLVREKFSLVTQPERVALAFATAGWKFDDPLGCRGFLDNILQFEPDDWVLRRREIALARIENRSPDFAALPPATPTVPETAD